MDAFSQISQLPDLTSTGFTALETNHLYAVDAIARVLRKQELGLLGNRFGEYVKL